MLRILACLLTDRADPNENVEIVTASVLLFVRVQPQSAFPTDEKHTSSNSACGAPRKREPQNASRLNAPFMFFWLRLRFSNATPPRQPAAPTVEKIQRSCKIVLCTPAQSAQGELGVMSDVLPPRRHLVATAQISAAVPVHASCHHHMGMSIGTQRR